jgi:hypothetical protein
MNTFSDKENEIMLEQIVLEDCPICRGAGMVTDEGGWSVQVECCDCSAHTIYVEYNNDAEKAEAERAVVRLWNIGKVVSSERGE